MSLTGPRPQLVRDCFFMTKNQRQRHTARPGLSGLAQINGRNSISWEDKIEWDLKYIEKVGLLEDIYIILKTVEKAFIKKEGIVYEDVNLYYYLVRDSSITKSEQYIRDDIILAVKDRIPCIRSNNYIRTECPCNIRFVATRIFLGSITCINCCKHLDSIIF